MSALIHSLPKFSDRMTALAEIQVREEMLDGLLPATGLRGRPSEELLTAARAWSSAVWAAAERDGPHPIDAESIQPSLSLAQRPVFVCGLHRSGTSLVRDLLDGHPRLSVLPSEGSFLTSLQRKIARLPDWEKLKYLGNEWIRRLANPINQPPYWLLGRTADGRAPYVSFARHLLGWWPIVERRFGANNPLWPHLAVVLAYASVSHPKEQDSVRWWVEKTPANEFYLRELWDALPKAHVIYVVRDPFAVYASRKRLELQNFGTFSSARRLIREMRRSYKIAAELVAGSDPFAAIRQAGGRSFRMIQYEDVIHRPQRAIEEIAAFLDIELHPMLLRPTVANVDTSANSSFVQSRVPGIVMTDTGNTEEELTMSESRSITSQVGPYAEALGYQVSRP